MVTSGIFLQLSASERSRDRFPGPALIFTVEPVGPKMLEGTRVIFNSFCIVLHRNGGFRAKNVVVKGELLDHPRESAR